MNITGLIRADIDRRDWSGVHIRGDKRQAFLLGDGRRRTRAGTSIIVRPQEMRP